MSKGLKIMSLGVINHGMSLSVQTNFEKKRCLFKRRIVRFKRRALFTVKKRSKYGENVVVNRSAELFFFFLNDSDNNDSNKVEVKDIKGLDNRLQLMATIQMTCGHIYQNTAT
jgi:hypothetical protein